MPPANGEAEGIGKMRRVDVMGGGLLGGGLESVQECPGGMKVRLPALTKSGLPTEFPSRWAMMPPTVSTSSMRNVARASTLEML